MAQRGAAIPVLNDKTKVSPVVKRRDNFLEEGGRRRNKQQRKKGCVRSVAFMFGIFTTAVPRGGTLDASLSWFGSLQWFFYQQITLTTITGSNVKNTEHGAPFIPNRRGKKPPNCPLEEAKMSLHKCSYFKGLKFTLVPARRKLQEHSHLTRTNTLHTWHTHTHTYSIVYRLTHRSPETAVIPSAIKKKTGRLTNGTTHTPNTLFITHHLHKQTHARTHTRTCARTHARSFCPSPLIAR